MSSLRGPRSQSLRLTTLRNPYRTDKRTWPILSRRYLRFPRILVRPWSGDRLLALFGSARFSRSNRWLQGSACPRPRCTASASAANCTTCASRTRSGSRQTLLRRSFARSLLPHPSDPDAEIRRCAHPDLRHADAARRHPARCGSTTSATRRRRCCSKRGDPIQHVQRILCHANARTTVDTYGHLCQ